MGTVDNHSRSLLGRKRLAPLPDQADRNELMGKVRVRVHARGLRRIFNQYFPEH